MDNSQQSDAQKGGSTRVMVWIIIGLTVGIIAITAWFIISTLSQKNEIAEQRALREQAELDMMQRDLKEDYDAFNEEFSTLENARQLIVNDSVKMELEQKYNDARLQIEKLTQELQNQKNLSAQEIKKLKDEISTLRNPLKHYVEEINKLKLENQQLRDENQEVKTQNEKLSAQVQQKQKENESLNRTVTLAEKLIVSNVDLKALNKKDKEEKNVKKAQRLRVTFAIGENPVAPVGEKTFYLRIISPSGQLLEGGGSFSFEGVSQAYTAKKVIEYAGKTIGKETIYWDVNTALIPGEYTVELFDDKYRLDSSKFNLK